MIYFSKLKTALIAGVCVLGVLLCIPNFVASPAPWFPWRQVHLGLDLRGGSYLLLEVDMAAVSRERLDSLADVIRTTLRNKIQFQPPQVQAPQNRVLVRLRDPQQTDDAVKLLQDATKDPSGAAPEYTVASTPGEITLALSEAGIRDRANAAILQSIEIVRRRIDETGVLDPQITRQGDNRIVVQLPGVDDPNRIKELIGKTAKMTFRLVDDTANPASPTPPPGDDLLTDEGQSGAKIAVRRRVEVDGANLTDARPGQDTQNNRWVVNFTLDSIGTRKFADVSTANTGKRFAIVLDDKVISAPVIREPITGGRGQISGNFTAASAQDLSVLLRAGALPAPLTVVEERSVGPELGADSIRAGAISLGIGLLLVMAYMAIFYGLFGWFANVALVFNLILQISVLSLLEATLTLPGMAGILLTLGVAVDANILINERIREEVRHGRTPLNALETGFRRAYGTIIDSNATAFLAHVMLFVFGSGPVRGFAVTITVGIVTTLFTATVVARLLTVRWYVGTRPSMLPV
jgi:protein-export membrane protein SecD